MRHTHLLLPLSILALAGCSTVTRNEAVFIASPPPTVVTAREALGTAKFYCAQHPGSDYAIGQGNSMLPLYRDNTVLVIDRPPLSSLRLGQTVIFVAADGTPVAHPLARLTRQGWVTRGLNNADEDPDPVTENNYRGVVVLALQATSSPIFAYQDQPKDDLATSN